MFLKKEQEEEMQREEIAEGNVDNEKVYENEMKKKHAA